MQIFTSQGNEKRDYHLSRIIGMLKACCAPRTTARAAARRVASYRIIIFRVYILAYGHGPAHGRGICNYDKRQTYMRACLFNGGPTNRCSAVAALAARTASSGSIGGFSSFEPAISAFAFSRAERLGDRSIRAAIAKRARIVWRAQRRSRN